MVFENICNLGSHLRSRLLFLDQIRDIYDAEERNRDQQKFYYTNSAMRRSSTAFSIMCMCLTIMYAAFAFTLTGLSKSVLAEWAADDDDRHHGYPLHHHQSNYHPKATPSSFVVGAAGYDGYIGERFDLGVSSVRRNTATSSAAGGFVAPTHPATDGTLT